MQRALSLRARLLEEGYAQLVLARRAVYGKVLLGTESEVTRVTGEAANVLMHEQVMPLQVLLLREPAPAAAAERLWRRRGRLRRS